MERSRRAGARAVVAAVAVAALAGCSGIEWSGSAAGDPSSSGPAPTASPMTSSAAPTTPTPTPTATPTATPTPTPTVTPSPSATPSPTITPTPTPRPTPTRTSLRYGDDGPKVLALQRRLSELGYWLGEPDGEFGPLTQQAVFALQKAAGIGRDGVVGPKTTRALERGVRPRTRIENGVEIDLDRQLLVVVRGGRASVILNTSTGNGEYYTSTSGNRAKAVTPRGDYRVYRQVDGPLTNSLGELWRPRFFYRGFAVHGSPNIPPYPASHGCARLSNSAINMIWARDLMPLGSRVLVH